MRLRTIFFLLLVPVGISLLATIAVYGSLPEQVPTSWSSSGEIHTHKPGFILFLTALLPGLFILLLRQLPATDERSEHYTKYERVYAAAAVVITAFLITIHWFIILAAFGTLLPVALVIQGIIGLIMLFVSRYLTTVRDPERLSIRTPWTIEHEEVWERSQSFGAKAFAAAGFVLFVSLLFPALAAFWVVLVTAAVLVISIFGYTWLQDKRFSQSQ